MDPDAFLSDSNAAEWMHGPVDPDYEAEQIWFAVDAFQSGAVGDAMAILRGEILGEPELAPILAPGLDEMRKRVELARLSEASPSPADAGPEFEARGDDAASTDTQNSGEAPHARGEDARGSSRALLPLSIAKWKDQWLAGLESDSLPAGLQTGLPSIDLPLSISRLWSSAPPQGEFMDIPMNPRGFPTVLNLWDMLANAVGSPGWFAEMYARFLFGTGPAFYEFTPESAETIRLRDSSRQIREARNFFYRKNKGLEPGELEPVYGFVAKWNEKDAYTTYAGDLVKQFVGTYGIDIAEEGGELHFHAWNDVTLQSNLLDLPLLDYLSFERHFQGQPLSTVRMTFDWSEPIDRSALESGFSDLP